MIPGDDKKTGEELQHLLDVLFSCDETTAREAYTEIYKALAPVLFDYGMLRHRNRVYVEDAVADTFRALWAKAYLSKGDSRVNLAWIFTTFRNNLVNQVRFQEIPLEQDELNAFAAPRDRRVDSIVEALYDEVENLPRELCEVIRLYLSGLPRYLIARIIGVDERTVRSRLKRAFQLLKRSLERQGLTLSIAIASLSLFLREAQASLPLEPPIPRPVPPPPPMPPASTLSSAFKGFFISLPLIGALVIAGFMQFVSSGSPDAACSPVSSPAASPPPVSAAPSPAPASVEDVSQVYGFGANDFGQLGITDPRADRPVPVPRLNDVLLLSSRFYHTLYLSWDGVSGFGAGDSLQLGTFPVAPMMRPTVKFPVPVSVTALSAGAEHSLALSDDGAVWAWGSNRCFRLGGWGEDSGVPRRVPGLVQVVAVSAGADHSLALRKDGTVWAWGANDHGQLGDGTRSPAPLPVRVKGLADVSAVEAGSSFSLAVDADGSVWMWGKNAAGLSGRGPGPDVLSPVLVPIPRRVIAVAAGESHALALADDGTVWAWGANDHGQAGADEGRAVLSPVQVRIKGGVIRIAAGLRHSLAISDDGRLWAWGADDCGQIGVTPAGDVFSPVLVDLPAPAREVYAGALHTLVLLVGPR